MHGEGYDSYPVNMLFLAVYSQKQHCVPSFILYALFASVKNFVSWTIISLDF